MTLAAALVRKIMDDPRVAYYFDPLTRTMEILTETYAQEIGEDLEVFRKRFYASLKFEEPTCSGCRE